jgi:glycosyltransferase involved in cell wall biosynthesis
MRIALIDPSLFSLPYDSKLALGLSRIGHDVTFHGRELRSEDEAPNSIPVLPSFYHASESRRGRALPAPLRLTLKGADHIWSMWRLLRQMQYHPPDVIHFQWLPLPVVDGAFLRRFEKVAPIVLTVHDTDPFNGEASASVQRQGVERCLRKFNQLIVHTKQGEARLRQLGISGERITVVPHGMLIEPVPRPHDQMDGNLTFLLFGKIRPYKGAELAIKAFLALPPQLREKARLRIVGKPYMDMEPLHALARMASTSIEIRTGFVAEHEIANLFGPGTIAIFPYREIEASGVLFLALAYGRPVIASALGCFAELLSDGLHGALVPIDDIASLTAAMQRLLADRRLASANAAAVQQLARDVPGWDELARRTVDCYRNARLRRDSN